MILMRFALCAAATLFTALALGAATSPAAATVIRTRIFKTDGSLVGSIFRSHDAGGTYWSSYPTDYSQECWLTLETDGRIKARFTHHVWGISRIAKRSQWYVRSGGRLVGVLVRRSLKRWDVFTNSTRGKRKYVAYAIGPDGPAAGTAYLLLPCEA
jgi:hypothetical protein